MIVPKALSQFEQLKHFGPIRLSILQCASVLCNPIETGKSGHEKRPTK